MVEAAGEGACNTGVGTTVHFEGDYQKVPNWVWL